MDVEDDDGLGTQFEVGRTAAFSDAVIAIAATLLVLDLRPPHVAPGQTLGRAVAGQWPSYVALVSSFLVIGLIWVHHHRLFRLLDRADHTLLNLNLLQMLAVLIVPFPTALLAEYPYERVSAVLYTSVVAVNALLFMLMWGHVRRQEGLLRPGIPAVVIRLIGLQYRIGVITYLVLVVVSFVSVHVSIAGNILVAVFFALPLNAIKRRESLDRPTRWTVRRLHLKSSEDSVATTRRIDEKDNASRTLQSAQRQEPSSQT